MIYYFIKNVCNIQIYRKIKRTTRNKIEKKLINT